MTRLAPAVLAVALGLVLSGCGGSEHAPLVFGLSRQALAGVDLRDGARFLSATRLAIVTSGSGSCPAVPDRLTVLEPDLIRIHLTMGSWRPTGKSGRTVLVAHPPDGGICTTDLTTTPMAVAIDPKQIDVHHRLTIHLYYYDSKKPITRTAPPL